MKLVMKMENNNLSVYFVSLPTNASTSKLGLHIDSQKKKIIIIIIIRGKQSRKLKMNSSNQDI